MLRLKHQLVEAQERIKSLEKELSYTNSERVQKKKVVMFLIERAKEKENINIKSECYAIAEIVGVTFGMVRNNWSISCK